MIIRSGDYHDYVFKGGKLIGEFEQMYQKAAGIPWNQDTASDKWYNQISLSIINRALDDKSVNSIHEIGCGLGYFIGNFHDKKYALSGSDISPTAVREARSRAAGIKFAVDDIRKRKKRPRYDLILSNALFWYVFPQIDVVLDNVRKMISRGGYFFIAESFPKLSSDFVGKDVLPDPERLSCILSKYFRPIIDARVMKLEFNKDGPNLYWLGKKT